MGWSVFWKVVGVLFLCLVSFFAGMVFVSVGMGAVTGSYPVLSCIGSLANQYQYPQDAESIRIIEDYCVEKYYGGVW